MDAATITAIKANLFPSSHASIDDWDKFPWHSHNGIIQTYKRESSQALAIDVFGSIMVSKDRDIILGSMARICSLPDEGPWALKLEWSDPDNLLREPRPTQVDAIAFGRRATLIIECKFTEPGGGCSQPTSSGVVHTKASDNATETTNHRSIQSTATKHAVRSQAKASAIGTSSPQFSGSIAFTTTNRVHSWMTLTNGCAISFLQTV
jgi:hypothetical protein